jgi:hypothetical protein
MALSLREFSVDPAEVLESPVDLGLDRPDPAAEKFGDLPEFEVLKAEKEQDFPFLNGQTVEGLADELGLPVGLVGGIGERRKIRRLGELFIQGEISLLFSQMIDVNVSCDLEEPDIEPAVALEAAPVFEDAHEDLLDEVFAHGPVSGQAEKEIKKHGLVPFEEDGQSFDPAVPNFGHQFTVCRRHMCFGPSCLAFSLHEYIPNPWNKVAVSWQNIKYLKIEQGAKNSLMCQ